MILLLHLLKAIDTITIEEVEGLVLAKIAFTEV